MACGNLPIVSTNMVTISFNNETKLHMIMRIKYTALSRVFKYQTVCPGWWTPKPGRSKHKRPSLRLSESAGLTIPVVRDYLLG